MYGVRYVRYWYVAVTLVKIEWCCRGNATAGNRDRGMFSLYIFFCLVFEIASICTYSLVLMHTVYMQTVFEVLQKIEPCLNATMITRNNVISRCANLTKVLNNHTKYSDYMIPIGKSSLCTPSVCDCKSCELGIFKPYGCPIITRGGPLLNISSTGPSKKSKR